MELHKGQKFQSSDIFYIVPKDYDFDKIKDKDFYSYNYITLKGNTSLEVINFDETSVELSIKSDNNVELSYNERNGGITKTGPAGTYQIANTQFSYVCDRQNFEKVISKGIIKEISSILPTKKKNYKPLIIGCLIGLVALTTTIILVKNKNNSHGI